MAESPARLNVRVGLLVRLDAAGSAAPVVQTRREPRTLGRGAGLLSDCARAAERLLLKARR